MKTMCLCMIVKNESHVIKRCIDSIRRLIDTWVIIDTGSTDDTKEKIKKILSDIPGELYERPWVNFAHNRTELLQLAKNKADYCIMIDADEILVFDDNFSVSNFKNNLTADALSILAKMGTIEYYRPQITKSDLKCEYRSPLHEYLHVEPPFTSENCKGFYNKPMQDSYRNTDPKKYYRDALVFENALLDEPNNERYVFYLAQSYRDSQQYQKALENYLKRAQMKGWVEEVFYSIYQVAHLKMALQHNRDEIIQTFLTAYEVAPWRAEALHDAAKYCRLNNLFHQAYILSSFGLGLPCPDGSLFVDRLIYTFSMLDEFSIAAFWSGRPLDSLNACEKLLTHNLVPPDQIERVKQNRQFALDKLNQASQGKEATDSGPNIAIAQPH